jgi:6-methylsalicylic acid synthase
LLGLYCDSIQVPLKTTKWPEVSRPRRAAICFYGYGGSVSHTVIETYQPVDHFADAEIDDDGPKVLLISTPQEKRLPGYATTLGKWMVEKGIELSLSSITCTLAARRGHYDCRAAFIASSYQEIHELTEKFASSTNSSNIITGRSLGKDTNTSAMWIFLGHGA